MGGVVLSLVGGPFSYCQQHHQLLIYNPFWSPSPVAEEVADKGHGGLRMRRGQRP